MVCQEQPTRPRALANRLPMSLQPASVESKNEQRRNVQFSNAASVSCRHDSLESRNVQSTKRAPCPVASVRSRSWNSTRSWTNPLMSSAYQSADVTVVSGQEEFLDRELDTLLNPTLIIEVLSNTTEGYDRGLKFKLYRALPSLKQYLLISSQYVGVDLFTRDADGQWLLTSKDNLDDTVHLTSIDCGLKLADLYDKVDFVRS